jgi:1-acyl-sn-glycerol-3-phosphate acyltransferase
MPGRKLPLFPRTTGAVLRAFFTILSRVTIEGVENLPADGPVMVVCNHASNADGMLMMAYVVPKMGRPMGWIGKEEALRWPFFGWAMKQNGVFGVRRGASGQEAFRTAKRVLDEGRALAVFPEGTRSRDGALQEANEGATVLAVRSGAPVLPMAISGSHRFWPRGKLLPRPRRRITVRIGPAFQLSMARAPDRHEAMRLTTAELMRHIAELLPVDQRGVYAGTIARPQEGLDGSGVG